MRRYLLVAAVTVTAALTGSIGADSVSAGAAVQDGRAGAVGRVGAGSELWRAHFQSDAFTLSDAMAVSPRSGTVFVTGESPFSRALGPGYQTVAYRPATGKRLWASRYHAPTKGQDEPDAMAVSPNGAIVVVTGYSNGPRTLTDYATVAYSAATGKRLWASLYHGLGKGINSAASVAVSPDGTTAYVTGYSSARDDSDTEFDTDYATVAYNAATGKQLWARSYHGPGKGINSAGSVAVSPGGGRIFVTGQSYTNNDDSFFATVAYSAATGKQLWVRRYGRGNGFNGAAQVAVGLGGSTVFVAGSSLRDSTTIAYKAATGKQLWISRYHGPGSGSGARSMAVNPRGTTVFVTGTSGGKHGYDFATVAYSAATGKRLWVGRYRGYEDQALAVNPHGTAVYVTGDGYGQAGFATVAYNAVTGQQLWGRNVGNENNYFAESIAASPDGTEVFVTGSLDAGQGEYLTIAYRS